MSFGSLVVWLQSYNLILNAPSSCVLFVHASHRYGRIDASLRLHRCVAKTMTSGLEYGLQFGKMRRSLEYCSLIRIFARNLLLY